MCKIFEEFSVHHFKCIKTHAFTLCMYSLSYSLKPLGHFISKSSIRDSVVLYFVYTST